MSTIPGVPLDLVPIWTLILALGVFFCVLLDDFDQVSAFSTASHRRRVRSW